MKQEIHITLCFNLANGKVDLNEIVYKLKELQSNAQSITNQSAVSRSSTRGEKIERENQFELIEQNA